MFEHLLKEAKRLLSKEPSAIQVNLIAADNGIYSFFRYDLESETEENRCLEQLAADNTRAAYVLCMWNDGTLDMLRWSLRRKLTERYPDARLLLLGEKGITAFPLVIIR